MRHKNKTNKTKSSSKTKKTKDQAHEFETMSQIQNRYGAGRARNGSDGSSVNNNFSNR